MNNSVVHVVKEIGLNGFKVVGVYASYLEAKEGLLSYKDSNGDPLSKYNSELEWVDDYSLIGMGGLFAFQIQERIIGTTYHGKSLSDSQEVLSLGQVSS